AAQPADLSRNLQLLQLRRLPGAPPAGPRAQRRHRQARTRAHLERLRPRHRPHPDRGDGKQPERRRLDRHTRSAAPVHGRPGPHRMNAPAPTRGSWGRVEFYTSFFLLAVLATVIGMRLGFESVWHLPTLDLDLSVVALALVLASF